MKYHTIGARVLAALLPLICAAGVAMPASADIPAVLMNAAMLTEKQGSYHMQITSPAGTEVIKSEGDVQSLSPMKMRMTTNMHEGAMQMVILAPVMYMKQGGAAWKKIAGDMADYKSMDVATTMAKDRGDYAVTDLGMALKDGQMEHGYKAVNTKKNTTSSIWLDSAGRFARIETAGTVMLFTKYGEPLNITAPM